MGLDMQAGVTTHMSPREKMGRPGLRAGSSHDARSWHDAARNQRILNSILTLQIAMKEYLSS